MRILWLTVDRSKRALRFYDDLRLAVGRQPGVELTTVTREIPSDTRAAADAIHTTGPLPASQTAQQIAAHDFVFTDAPAFYIDEPWGAAPGGVLMGDQHGPLVEWYIGACIKRRLQVFSVYRDALWTYWPELAKQDIPWIPNCVGPDSFHYHDVERRPIVLSTGVLNANVYPVRTMAHKRLQGQPFYERVERPKETADGPGHPAGAAYVRLLQSARLAIACSSVHSYTVTKYFEIPAAGACLLAEATPELRALGFQPQINYIPLGLRDPLLVDNARSWTSDEGAEQIQAIASAGHELVRSRHTADVRAAEFLEYAKEVGRTW